MQSAQVENKTESGNLLEHNHKRMLTIADIANLFSWFVLIVYVGLAIFSSIGQYEMLTADKTFLSSYRLMLDINSIVRAILVDLRIFCTGLVYALILKGTSLGLKMLVETNLNYKLGKEEGESHE
jgi:hypothetical protein